MHHAIVPPLPRGRSQVPKGCVVFKQCQSKEMHFVCVRGIIVIIKEGNQERRKKKYTLKKSCVRDRRRRGISRRKDVWENKALLGEEKGHGYGRRDQDARHGLSRRIISLIPTWD